MAESQMVPKRNMLLASLLVCYSVLGHGAKVLVNHSPQTKSHAMGMNRCSMAHSCPLLAVHALA